MIQLLIGGVRSGKSDAAENILNGIVKTKQTIKPAYIATSVAMGDETIARIQKHQKDSSRAALAVRKQACHHYKWCDQTC